MDKSININLKALLAWGLIGLLTAIITTNLVNYFHINCNNALFYSNIFNVWFVIFLIKLREYYPDYFTATILLFFLVALASLLTSDIISINISSIGWMIIGLLFGILLSIIGVVLFINDED